MPPVLPVDPRTGAPMALDPGQEQQRAFAKGVMPETAIQTTIDSNLRGTLAIRLPGITGVVKFGDWRWMTIYNRMYWREGSQGEQFFFASGKGVNIVGSQRTALAVDTNQPRQGDSGLPVDWGAYIYQVKLSIEMVCGTDDPDTTPTDLDPTSLDIAAPNARIQSEIHWKVIFTFEANDKSRLRAHYFDFPQGRGAYNLGNNDVGFDNALNGVPSPRDGHQLIVPVQLDANQQYNVEGNATRTLALDQAQVVNDRENTSLLMECNLEGLYKVKVV